MGKKGKRQNNNSSHKTEKEFSLPTDTILIHGSEIKRTEVFETTKKECPFCKQGWNSNQKMAIKIKGNEPLFRVGSYCQTCQFLRLTPLEGLSKSIDSAAIENKLYGSEDLVKEREQPKMKSAFDLDGLSLQKAIRDAKTPKRKKQTFNAGPSVIAPKTNPSQIKKKDKSKKPLIEDGGYLDDIATESKTSGETKNKVKQEAPIKYIELNPSIPVYLTKSSDTIGFSMVHQHKGLKKINLKMRFEQGNTKEYFLSSDVRYCKDCDKYYLPRAKFDQFCNNYRRFRPSFQLILLEDDNQYVTGQRKTMQPIDISKSKNLIVPPGNRIIVVKRDMFSCLRKGHHIESVRTDIPILGKKGAFQFVIVEVQFCVEEGKFFMYENDFLNDFYGRFTSAQVLRTFVYENKNWGMPIFSNMSLQSPLGIAGYNVNQQSNLPSHERQSILDRVIRFGILSVEETKNYLQYFISFHGSQEKNYNAKLKWQEDLDYIRMSYPGKYIGPWIAKSSFSSK